MIYLIPPPATLFSLLLPLFLYVNSVARQRKRGGLGVQEKKGGWWWWRGSRHQRHQGPKRNYSSLNCFHHSKYSNNFFFLKGGEIILKKASVTALCGTSWGLLSHLLARKLSALAEDAFNQFKGSLLTGRPPPFSSRSHRPALWSYVAHKP